MRPETEAETDDNRFGFDFSDEEPTQETPPEMMEELMETLRSPGIPTTASERPTRPIRPMVMWRKDLLEEEDR